MYTVGMDRFVVVVILKDSEECVLGEYNLHAVKLFIFSLPTQPGFCPPFSVLEIIATGASSKSHSCCNCFS